MKKLTRKEMAIDILSGLLDGRYQPVQKCNGLCYNFHVLVEEIHDVSHANLGWFITEYLMESHYDIYTGDPGTPVPHPNDDYGHIYFDLKAISKNIWDKRTTYGKSRWKFVEFCLKAAQEWDGEVDHD